MGDSSSLRAGFTLIELILVMALLVIAMGIAAPMLGGTTRAAIVESEARRVTALLERARSEALARAVPVRAWLAPAARRGGWETLPGYDDDGASPTPLQLRDDLEYRIENAPASPGGDTIALAEFDPAGDVVGGRAATVTLTDLRGESRTIRLGEDGWSFEIVLTEATR